MGNLGSFVVLCILNRICFERARDLVGYPRDWPCLLNGDDILTKGEDGFFYSWLFRTAEVGFVINKKKTMRSKEYGDLNSQTYRYSKRRMVKKLCFGFLASDSWKEPVGSLATPLFDLCRQVRYSTATSLLTSRPVRSLFRRAPIPLQTIPHRWWNFLVKKAWFRGSIDRDPVEATREGTERKLPFVLGPPIVTSGAIEAEIRAADQEVIAVCVNEWAGRPVCPLSETRPAPKDGVYRSRWKLGRVVEGWRRLWLAPTLEAFWLRYSHLFVPDGQEWVDEQPGLQLTYKLTRKPRKPFSFAPPALPDAIQVLTIDGVVLRCA